MLLKGATVKDFTQELRATQFFSNSGRERVERKGALVSLSYSSRKARMVFSSLPSSVSVAMRLLNTCAIGAADESKKKTDEDAGADEDQTQPNEAHDDEEGNLGDDGEEEDEEGTGQQEQQGPQDTEEPANLDLPDDLQLDEEGNEGNDGGSHQFCLPLKLISCSIQSFRKLNP